MAAGLHLDIPKGNDNFYAISKGAEDDREEIGSAAGDA